MRVQERREASTPDRSFAHAASLLIGVDSAHPAVKIYSLHPELGRITGYGAGRGDRNASYFSTRKRLQENGIIKIEGDALTFLRPYTFANPTAAAQLLCAGSVPGPLHWKRIGDHKPLRDIKEST